MASDAPSSLVFPNAEAGAAAAAERARAVDAELGQIFGTPSKPKGRRVRAIPIERLAAASDQPERRHRRPLATFGAIGTVALVGVAAGSLLTKLTRQPPAEAPAPAVERRLSIIAPSADVLAPMRQTEAAKPAVSELPAASEPPPATKPRPHRARAEAGKAAGYEQVLAADRKLRAAYASAERAGVARGVLVNDSVRWSQLRREARRNPRALVKGYAGLTRDLERATLRARGEGRRERPRPLHFFRWPWGR